MSKKVNIFICIIGVIILSCALFLLKKADTKDEEIYDTNLQVLKNNNEFYTISNCLNKFIMYYKQENKEAILSLLTKNYIDKNKINSSNVLNKSDIDKNTEFALEKVLVKRINEKEIKYYIHASLWELQMTMNSDGTKTDIRDKYYIMYMKDNADETIFSLEPYNGKEFKEGVSQ